uniref:Uncharacterized protein n=1 Tax=Salarias fasciatus TaxID=181472 RepID=A0A672FVH4_SALFA
MSDLLSSCDPSWTLGPSGIGLLAVLDVKRGGSLTFCPTFLEQPAGGAQGRGERQCDLFFSTHVIFYDGLTCLQTHLKSIFQMLQFKGKCLNFVVLWWYIYVNTFCFILIYEKCSTSKDSFVYMAKTIINCKSLRSKKETFVQAREAFWEYGPWIKKPRACNL